MGNHQNSIELNGKVYDVATGSPIMPRIIKPKATKPRSLKPIHTTKKGTVVDGFIRKPANFSKQRQQRAPGKTAIDKQERLHKPLRANNKAPRLQKSKTLMRAAVKKPIKPKLEEQNLKSTHNKERLQRAKKIEKSTRIKRFMSPIHSSPGSTSKKSPWNGSTNFSSPESKKASNQADYLSAISLNSTKIENPISRHNKSEEVIANALRNAQSHKSSSKPLKKPKNRLAQRLGFSRRAASITITTLTIIILGGFVLYQNIPNLSMRIASSRAGFSANMPAYKPSGFSMSGPVEYGPGKVKISFSSNSDQRSFSLTQQVSNWNSAALVDNYMVASNKQYQTFDDNGKTIYIYDSSNATWVSGGVWYQIEGNSSLNSDQLLKIANSI